MTPFRPTSPLTRPPIPLDWLAAGSVAAGLWPGRASAHIKWFAPYDVAQSPVPVREVMSGYFLIVLAGFALLIVGGFLLDRLAARAGWRIAGPLREEALEEQAIRAGMGAFCVALFATGGTILTPELRTAAEWPAWLQLGIAATMLSARTCALGGLGLVALYGYGVERYGIFHLSDYPMFLGIAAYLALTSLPPAWARWRASRMPILYLTVCGSLMWVAVEKWAYPQWTFPLLEARPYLTLGVPAEHVMVVAGFVEFSLAFYLLTGLGLLRLGIAGLGLIFAAAIVDFGKLDAIGHLPTLACLLAMFIHGPTALHRRLHDAGRGLFADAGRAGLSFAAAMGVVFAAYYGMQAAEYPAASGRQGAALAPALALAAPAST